MNREGKPKDWQEKLLAGLWNLEEAALGALAAGGYRAGEIGRDTRNNWLANMSGRKRVLLSQQEVDRIVVSEGDDPTAWGKVTRVEPKRRRLNQRVVLLRDLPVQRLRAGDVGTIVARHPASGKTRLLTKSNSLPPTARRSPSF